MPHRNNMLCCICEIKCHFGAAYIRFHKKFDGDYLIEPPLHQHFALQQ
jgi:hypothetical protein